jgi:peptidoglycan hydrolase-like protein with peptidoglycan-binding domain
MCRTSSRVWAGVLFTFLAIGVLGPGRMPLAFAVSPSEGEAAVLNQKDIKNVQEILRDKGYYTGRIDGLMGPKTRAGIRQYQESENLPVTGYLDAQTADKIGFGPESVGASFKGAGLEVGKGGAEVGHEMKKGKPVAAGKEMGKALGRAGKKVGSGVKKAVSPESDRGEREKE